MFWEIVCFKPAEAAVADSRLKDVEDGVDVSFGSTWEKMFPIS
jgi:hypothetical protein